MAKSVKRDVYPGDIVMKRIKGSPGWGEQQFKLGTVMSQAATSSAYVNHNSKSFHVLWEQNSRVELSNVHQVGVVNRQLGRGTKVTGEDGREGTVRASKTLATVHVLGTTNVIDKVPTERLNPISQFVRGQQIMYKGWVGYIVNLRKNVHFVLDGGMGFHIPSRETDGFVRNDLYWGPGVTCPGMRSKISGRQMKNAVWTARPLRFITRFFPQFNYLYSMTPCTVMKTEITQLEVDWLQVAPGIDDPGSVRKPHPVILQEDFGGVTIVGEPSSEVLGYNSVRILRVKPEDTITTLDKWTDFFVRKFADDHDLKEPEKAPEEFYEKIRVMASSDRPYEVAVKILNLHTVIDVEWKDGTKSTIPATKVVSVTTYDSTGDYPIGMIIAPLYKAPNDGGRYGVVQESGMSMGEDGKARTGKLKVKWVTKDGIVSEPEEVSSFDIRPHTTYSMYMRGSIVFPRNYGTVPFKSGYVIDMDVAAAKLIIVCPATMERHEVFPHTVIPFSTRVFWNFFQTKYMKDTILPPPYQLKVEFSPLRFYPEDTPEPPANLLLPPNNNSESDLTTAAIPKEFCIWDEPSFDMLASAPASHRFYKTKETSRGTGKKFSLLMAKEFEVMKQTGTIPEGIWVRSYENRMDLMSVLMVGPSQTIYEEGIFLFDLQLSPAFPSEPPRTHFVSYSMEINPLTSWDGNFCLSSLEWNFALVENKPASYIANFVAQIQGKIFAKEPFFCDQNKAVDTKSPAAIARSRMYNEQTFIRVLDSMWNMIHFPHQPWEQFIKSHFAATLPSKLAEVQSWDLSSSPSGTGEGLPKGPSYPLAPVCVGFSEALGKRLEKFRKIIPAVVVTASLNKVTDIENADVIIDETADSESTPVTENAEPAIKVPGEIKIELVEPVSSVNANLKNLIETEYVEIENRPQQQEVPVASASHQKSSSGSEASSQKSSRPGTPVHETSTPRSRPGSPPALSARDEMSTPRSRPGSPPSASSAREESTPRSRPGSPPKVSAAIREEISTPRSRPGSPPVSTKEEITPRSRPGTPPVPPIREEPTQKSRPGSPVPPIREEVTTPPQKSRPGSPVPPIREEVTPSPQKSRPGSPVAPMPAPAVEEKETPRSRPGSPQNTKRSSRPGSPVLNTARSGSPSSTGSGSVASGSPRVGSPVRSKKTSSSPRTGSPVKKNSRPGSPKYQAFPQQSDRSPVTPRSDSSSRPGSPAAIKEIPTTIPDLFKIPTRKTSSERTGSADEAESVSSGQTGKISAWPVKPRTPEEFATDPDLLAAQGLMAQMKQPLDSLKNMVKNKKNKQGGSSKGSSKGSNSSKPSKIKSKKRKDKTKKKQKVTGVSSPPGSSVGSGGSGGSAGESDMDETDLDLNRRLERPSSPDSDGRPYSSGTDRDSAPEEV